MPTSNIQYVPLTTIIKCYSFKTQVKSYYILIHICLLTVKINFIFSIETVCGSFMNSLLGFSPFSLMIPVSSLHYIYECFSVTFVVNISKKNIFYTFSFCLSGYRFVSLRVSVTTCMKCPVKFLESLPGHMLTALVLMCQNQCGSFSPAFDTICAYPYSDGQIGSWGGGCALSWQRATWQILTSW